MEISATLAGSESPAAGGVAGMTTTASVAGTSGVLLTCRKPSCAKPASIACACWAPMPGPSLVTIAAASTLAALSWPASCGSAACWVPWPANPGSASCCASAIRVFSLVALVSKNCCCNATWPVTVLRAWSGDQHHALAVEQVGEQQRRVRLGERLVGTDPLTERTIRHVLGADLVVQGSGLVLKRAQGDPAQRRGAEHDPDGQGEEDGHDGDEVIAEVDH